MIDECSPNGAVDDTIPHGPGAGNSPASHSADASWASVFPSIVWGLLKYNGDTTVDKYWHGLTRFMDNEWTHIGNGTSKDITKMFAQFGDWCPPPPSGKVTAKFTAGFSFVNDIAHMVEVAKHVGTAADVTKYQAILTASTKMFHDAWYVADKKYYADGGQTAQVLALQVNAPPDAATKEAVLTHLVNDIVVTHSNHTTCGIIGWRWELDILSANGYADVAYAIITQQTYPGYGYEILNEYEPATTVWELWDGDSQGPGMNSRDHIMFGGPGKWIYSYVGGIRQTDTSIGFEHVVLSPPATLIEQAVTASITPNSTISHPLQWATASHTTLRGTIELQWAVPPQKASAQCDVESENADVKLDCPGSTIAGIAFANYGTLMSSDCATGLKTGSCLSNATFKSFVSDCCVGKASCSFKCGDRVNGGCSCGSKTVAIADPCFGTAKKVAAQVTCASAPGADGYTLNLKTIVPAGSDAQLVVPLLGSSADKITIKEGATPVFSGGQYKPGAEGVTGAVAGADSIIISHGSGEYMFVRMG
jgi:hypothetical protein